MSLDNLNEEQKEAVERAKTFPKKAGRPTKEFGPVIKIAAKILKDTGLSVAEIARELQCHPTTIKKALRDTKLVNVDVKDVNAVRDQWQAHIAQIVLKMLTQANTEEYIYNLARSRNPGLIQAVASLIEKHNLLANKPTSIVEVQEQAQRISDKLKELDELEAALKEITPLPDSPKAN